MLSHYPDLDAHLDYLDNIDGHCFKISKSETNRKQLKEIYDKIENKILTGDKKHTVIFIEKPPSRRLHIITGSLNNLSKKIDRKKHHQIHVFFPPTELFEMMINEVTDWD